MARGHAKHQQCHPPAVRNVSLASIFAHRSLAQTARLTVRIVRRRYVGKGWVIAVNRPNSLAASSCLAPGSTVAGKGC